MPIPEDVVALLSVQHGLASIAQLLERGLPRHVIRSRLQRDWVLALPRVVATFRSPLTPAQRLVAAQLHVGADGVIGSLTAAAWHGITAADVDRRVHVLVPARRTVDHQAFVRVHRTRRPDASPWQRLPLVLSSPSRAAVDAARDAPAWSTCRAILIEAAQRRIATPEALRHEVAVGPRGGSARLYRALAEVEAGAWSVPEADLLALCERSTVLPAVVANPRLVLPDGTVLPRPDAWFDDVALAVQVHSRRFHAGALDWERTVAEDNVFAEHGIALVAVTPTRIRERPEDVLRTIERAYVAVRERPRPPVVLLRGLVP